MSCRSHSGRSAMLLCLEEVDLRFLIPLRFIRNHYGLVRPHKRDENGDASSRSAGCRGLDSGLHRNDGMGVVAVYFQSNRSCRLSPTPPIMKMAVVPGTGNHKGCPYNRFAGAYFQRNRSCRLSPTPPIMKMAVGAIRESPLREIGRGLFSENDRRRGY